MQIQKEQYGQNRKPVKRYTFTLPGESTPRTCFSLKEMMEIIKGFCPHGKMKELQNA